MKITATTLKRPIAAMVLGIAVFATGVFSLANLEVDYLPELTYPMVRIHIWWSGATPEEIETNIADPLEQVMATVDNLDYLESTSTEGMYTLLVNFQYGVRLEDAYQDVMAIMGRVARQLPPDIDAPVVMKADPSQSPIIEVTLSSDQRDLVWLRDWADNWLVERITAVPGTAGVEVIGGLKREIRVHLDPRRLQAYALSPALIARVLHEENVQSFAGRVTIESREIIARTMGEFESVEEIENVVIARGPAGEKVYLRDVASVEDSHEEMRVNTRFNGQPCVKLAVLKQAAANTVTVSDTVQRRLEELGPYIPEDIEFGYVENQGDYVMGAINSVRNSAFLAALLVIAVVYLFLGRWRQVLVMAVALPLTLLANFFVMRVAGFSINVFSLGGLVVALGVILDNSIVVLENITRLKSEGRANSARDGTEEVGSAIVASTLTFLAIFLPFLFVPGLSALLFKELVLVVAGVVIISLLVAVTITPLLTSRLVTTIEVERVSGIARRFDEVIGLVTRAYSRLLDICLGARPAVVIIALAAFGGGLFLAQKTGSEFLPRLDDGRVMVKVVMPSGTSVGEVDRVLSRLEEQIRDLPEIQSIFSLAGGRVWGVALVENAVEGELNIQLVPKSQRDISTADFVSKIRPMIGRVQVPGARIPVMQMRARGIRRSGDQQVEVNITGAELVPVYEFAGEVAAKLQETPDLIGVNVSMHISKPEYRVYVDRARASDRGLSTHHVATTLRTLVSGMVSTQYRDGSHYYGVRLVVPETSLNSRSDLENLVVDSSGDQPVYLRDIARVERAVGPIEIVRENQAKKVVVQADSGRLSVGEALAQAERAVAELEPPFGVEVRMGGQAQVMAENRQVMGLILGFAALFAFVVLAIRFESVVLPFLIMVNVPLALTGAFLALFLTGTPIGITVQIGMVIMMGGITSQGVVLLALAEQYRGEGLSSLEAIRKAAPIRIRPILMTQLTTVLGLTPLALNIGEGGDMLVPMAIAVIGGLLYSLLLTLLFLPSAYALVRRDRGRIPSPISSEEMSGYAQDSRSSIVGPGRE